jgi:hypothetical protein
LEREGIFIILLNIYYKSLIRIGYILILILRYNITNMRNDESYDFDKNGWNEWSKHVLIELKRHDKSLQGLKEERYKDRESIIEKITDMKEEFNDGVNEIENSVIKLSKDLESIAATKGAVIGGIVSFMVALFTTAVVTMVNGLV